MENIEFQSLDFLLDAIEPSKSYDICKVMENEIKYYSFGYDSKGKIYVSDITLNRIAEYKNLNYHTTLEGYRAIQTILNYDYKCGIYQENIPIYKKMDDAFDKMFTIEVDIIKVKDPNPADSIVGRARVDTTDLVFDVTNEKIRQNMHDVKNQLMSIGAFASYISTVSQNKEIIDYVYNIKDAVYNCNYLINEATGRTHPKFNKRIDIHKILGYYISVIKMDKNIMVECNLDAENTIVKGNHYALSNAIQNILLNAVQAIENEGIIKIRTTNQKNNIKISISDNGCGIPEDNIDKIFENYFTTKDFGSGIGLYTTMQTISMNKGTINVESELDEGTTFHILFPND